MQRSLEAASTISHTQAVLKNCNKLSSNLYITAKYITMISHCLFTLAIRLHSTRLAYTSHERTQMSCPALRTLVSETHTIALTVDKGCAPKGLER